MFPKMLVKVNSRNFVCVESNNNAIKGNSIICERENLDGK